MHQIARIDSEVLAVGTAKNLKEVIIQEIWSGIEILQSQDNHLVEEATELVAGIRRELEDHSKQICNNLLQILGVKSLNQSIQNGISVLTRRIDGVNTTFAAITETLQTIPSQ